MAPDANGLGRTAAKVLGIDVDYRERNEPREAVRSAADSFEHVETYEEREPTVAEFLRECRPTIHGTLAYLRSLFPFLSWILHYNLTWLLGDVVAGTLASLMRTRCEDCQLRSPNPANVAPAC